MKFVSKPLLGWYSIFTFRIEETINPEELKWSLKEDENVALLLLDIHFYKDKPLDFFALSNMQKILQFFQEHQKTIIFRPTYDTIGNASQQEPDSFELVKTHLKQISQHIESVFVFQGLLVGDWAEMHGGKYCNDEGFQELLRIIYPNLKQTFLAVRKPSMYRLLDCRDKLTLFDDAIFGSSTHLGTFGLKPKSCSEKNESWIVDDELKFMDDECKEKPVGGEIVFSDEVQSRNFYLNQCQKMHLSYLNKHHDLKMLEFFKTISENGHTLYDDLNLHIGSRFEIKDFQMRAGWNKNTYMCTIENIGFAYNFEPVMLVVSSNKKIILNVYIQLLSREEKKIKFRVQKNLDFSIKIKRQNGQCLLSLTNKDFA